MNKTYKVVSLTNPQAVLLIILRIVIGWHFLYEGLVKIFTPNWSSIGFLLDSQGPLSAFFHAMAANNSVVQIVDMLNIWGLIFIGLGLVLGVLTQTATIAGILLLLLYYLSHPPLASAAYMLPNEGSYLIVNKNLVELFALAVLYVFPTGRIVGIDRLISAIANKKKQFKQPVV